MFFEPLVQVVVVILLAPEHAGQGLAHHPGCVFRRARRCDGGVKLIRLVPASLHGFIKLLSQDPLVLLPSGFAWKF